MKRNYKLNCNCTEAACDTLGAEIQIISTRFLNNQNHTKVIVLEATGALEAEHYSGD